MKWLIDDFRKSKKKYPNILNAVSKHGHFFQARSNYGDLSNMHKSKDSAIEWARKRNKTKSFNYTENEDEYYG